MFRMMMRKRLEMQSQLDTSKNQNEFPKEIFTEVQKNLDNIKEIMQSPSDLVTRTFAIGKSKHPCAIICIDGLVDKDLINDKIIKMIQNSMNDDSKEKENNKEKSLSSSENSNESDNKNATQDQSDKTKRSIFKNATQGQNEKESIKTKQVAGQKVIQQIETEIIASNEVQKVNTLDEVMFAILSGNTALFIDGTNDVLLIGSKGWATRTVEEPSTETLVRGPRDGFTENLYTNTAHVRRHIRDPNLRMDGYKVGRRSKKDLIVSYIAGIAHPEIINEVKRRLKTIDIDNVPETGIIEEWIEDSFLSPFPTVFHTERPDKVASALNQGKVAILLDGTPFVLIAPVTFGSLLQSPEDYYERWMIGTLLRVLRYIAAFLAVFLPALYIALVSYSPGMIPSKLAFSIAATREGVPFPAFIEAVLMITALELLREAGIRLPKPIGQTIGIVGGLILGEAAVTAGIISPIMVIVVALTAISSFSVPSYSVAIAFRLIVYSMMLSAAFLGLYGLILGYIMLNIHLVNLKSFGIPYSTPFAPSFYEDWKDLVLRAPIMMLDKRPQMMQTGDNKRMKKGRNTS